MAKGELTKAYEEAFAETKELEEQLRESASRLYEAYYNLLTKRIEGLFGSNRVIRKNDGKEGVLKVYPDSYHKYTTPCEIKFYPITKKGKVSLNSSGYVWSHAKEGLLSKFEKCK